ncbi:MAG: NUDIX hydrolase [Verrucomicrobia bacterium]|nr:NUDIX hydrolase [Verrucomicrobiota bacterium]
MMKALALFLILSSFLFADADYNKILHQFTETLGRHGSWKQGEIEIATSPEEIKLIEKQCCQRYVRMGYSKANAEKYSRVGIIAEDHYLIWVRDAVTFPGGIPGVYDRIIWKGGLNGVCGVVVLPVLENKKIVLNINFRHATRTWEMELPRGGCKDKESIQESAARELKEETGCVAKEFILLGNFTPDTGILSATIPVFYGKIQERKERHQDQSEAIALNIDLSLDEIREAFLKGYIIIDIKGVKTKVYCRDGYLSYALLQAIWHKLI